MRNEVYALAVLGALAGCGPDSGNVVDCKLGPSEGSVTRELPKDAITSLGGQMITSLGNGRATIDNPQHVIFGEDKASSEKPNFAETLVKGRNSIQFRSPGGPFSYSSLTTTINIGPGENGATRVTANFSCDRPQPQPSATNK